MDEFEKSDSEKKTNDSHNTCYQHMRYIMRLQGSRSALLPNNMFLDESIVT